MEQAKNQQSPSFEFSVIDERFLFLLKDIDVFYVYLWPQKDGSIEPSSGYGRSDIRIMPNNILIDVVESYHAPNIDLKYTAAGGFVGGIGGAMTGLLIDTFRNTDSMGADTSDVEKERDYLIGGTARDILLYYGGIIVNRHSIHSLTISDDQIAIVMQEGYCGFFTVIEPTSSALTKDPRRPIGLAYIGIKNSSKQTRLLQRLLDCWRKGQPIQKSSPVPASECNLCVGTILQMEPDDGLKDYGDVNFDHILNSDEYRKAVYRRWPFLTKKERKKVFQLENVPSASRMKIYEVFKESLNQKIELNKKILFYLWLLTSPYYLYIVLQYYSNLVPFQLPFDVEAGTLAGAGIIFVLPNIVITPILLGDSWSFWRDRRALEAICTTVKSHG